MKVLDPDRLEVRFNADWSMPIENLSLMAVATVAQVVERDDFAKRFRPMGRRSRYLNCSTRCYRIRLGRGPGRRRARRHRPEVQSAARAPHPARCTGSPTDR